MISTSAAIAEVLSRIDPTLNLMYVERASVHWHVGDGGKEEGYGDELPRWAWRGQQGHHCPHTSSSHQPWLARVHERMPSGSQDDDSFIAPTDRDGCDIETNIFGAGFQFQVNTDRPFKVARFHAPAGELTDIEQFNVHFFSKRGGMEQVVEALDRRMVFVISTQSMNWHGSRVDCDSSEPEG